MKTEYGNKGVSDVCSLIVLIAASLVICLIVIMNVLIDEPLFIRGINFIHDYQTAQPYGIIQVI